MQRLLTLLVGGAIASSGCADRTAISTTTGETETIGTESDATFTSSTTDSMSSSTTSGAVSSTSTSTGDASTTSSTFGCIEHVGAHPSADPASFEHGAECATRDEASCEKDELCLTVRGRRVEECSADRPICSPETEFLGCVGWSLCKLGPHLYCNPEDLSEVYYSDRDCPPYGFDSCDAPALSGSDDVSPTCSY